MMSLFHIHNPVRFAREMLGIEPDAVQAELLNTKRSRVILNCRRQWGKSTMAAIRAVHQAAAQEEQTIVILSTTMRQSRELARRCAQLAKRLGAKVRTDGTNPRSMVFPNGSLILPLPAKADFVRGFTAHLVIVDEAARVSDEVLAAATPMLATTGGGLWLLSTPNGMGGMFAEVWHARATGKEDDWLRIEGKAGDGTGAEVTPDFYEREKQNKRAEEYAAEHEAAFTSTERSVFAEEQLERAFRPEVPAFDELAQTTLQFVRHRPLYYVGLDLAGVNDHAALVVLEYRPTPTGTRDPATYQFLYRRDLRVVLVEQFRRKTPYKEVVQRVARLCRHQHLAGHTQLLVEHNGPGVPVVQMLRDERLPVSLLAVTTTGGETAAPSATGWSVPKKEMVNVMEILLERGLLKVAAGLGQADLLRQELRQFEKRGKRGGAMQFGAGAGHDDLVMALGMACWWVWTNRRHQLLGPEAKPLD